LNALSGREVDTLISTIGSDVAVKLYANRHFQHKKVQKSPSALDRLLRHINRNKTANLLVVENYQCFNCLMSDSFVLDYFQRRIRLIDARMEVYIKSEKDYQEFSRFLGKLGKVDASAFDKRISVSKTWKEVEVELKKAKSKKGVNVEIKNKNFKDNTCQKIFSTLFLLCVYRQRNMKQSSGLIT